MKKMMLISFLLSVGQLSADENHGWALVYTHRVVDTTHMYAMYCPDNPGCNTAYKDEEVTEWFPTRELAIKRMNRASFEIIGVVGTTDISDFYPSWIIKPSNLVGLFRAQRDDVKQKKVGMHKELIQRQDEVEMPTMEWQ